MRDLAPAAVLRALSAACVLLAVALCAVSPWGGVPWWAVPLTAAGVATVELAVHRSARGGPHRPSSLVEGAVAACLVVADGTWSVVAVGLGTAVACGVRHSPPAHRELDVARCVLGTALAQAVSAAGGGGLLAVCAGAAAFFATSGALLALGVSITSSRPLPALLASRAPLAGLHAAAAAAGGLSAGVLALEAPGALLALVVLAWVLRSVWDGAGRSGGPGLLAELVRGASGAQDAPARLVTTAARLLGGADVELLVLAPDGPVLVVGDESGPRQSEPAGDLDEPWVRRALGARGVQAGRASGRPYVTTVVGSDRPLAVLRARRSAGTPHFDRRELRLAGALAAAAEAELSGPAGTPRGTADRELGTAHPLQALERALASSPDDEWTTTGVLR